MHRRSLLAALAAPALLPLAANAGMIDAGERGVLPSSGRDESARLQALLREGAREGRPVLLPRGDYVAANLMLPPNIELHGAGARLIYSGNGGLLEGRGCERVRLSGLSFIGGQRRTLDALAGMVTLTDCADIRIGDCSFTEPSGVGLRVERCGGAVSSSRFSRIGGAAAIFAIDSTGLAIRDNHISDAADGGILVHRSAAGADGTIVSGNRIARVRADSGGTGPYGNGINTYLAHGVKIAGNHISDCAFSAVRCHSATNATITGNTALRSGETALYAEFEFQGAVIANNIVDGGAVGISIANFLQGGRMAVCANNLVRNMVDRGPYPAENAGFGHGIFVEADTTVSGNVIDGVARWGLSLGWGPYLRDVAVTGNTVRDVGIGIVPTVAEGAGKALIANNIIAARSSAIVGHEWTRAATGDLATGTSAPPHLTISGNA